MYIPISNSSNIHKRPFSVWREEIHTCPVCKNGTLYPIGRRERTVIGTDGIKRTYLIWRLQCPHCCKIHHELPDFMVPYKRYTAMTIEAAIEGKIDNIPCFDSTISGFQRWFWRISEQLVMILQQLQTSANLPEQQVPSLPKIKTLAGSAADWLKRVVSLLVNSGKWQQTRFLC